MELTIIRNHVLRGVSRLPTPYDQVDVDEIDDAIKQVQDTYIQPATLLEAKKDHKVRGDIYVEDEDNPLDATNKIYTATYKPFKYGTTVTVKVDGEVVAEDEEGHEHTIDYEEGQVTFEAAQADVTVTYVSEEVIDKDDLATDIYRFDFIRDITLGLPGNDVSLRFSHDHTTYSCVQLYKEKLYFRNIDRNSLLRFYYFKKLRPLGAGEGEVTVPDIDSEWHDLYWMGALAQFDERKYPIFDSRLREYRREREEKVRQRPFQTRPNW